MNSNRGHVVFFVYDTGSGVAQIGGKCETKNCDKLTEGLMTNMWERLRRIFVLRRNARIPVIFAHFVKPPPQKSCRKPSLVVCSLLYP